MFEEAFLETHATALADLRNGILYKRDDNKHCGQPTVSGTVLSRDMTVVVSWASTAKTALF